MKTILFQGDSITDAQRLREDPDHLGSGYPLLVAAKLGYEYPNEYKFVNRGISGNKSVDVAARLEEDIINVEPDYMSILVGVNDVWHGIDYDWWATPEDLERSLVEIISETMAERPGVKIMLLEPYVMKECATDNTEEKPNKWDTFRREVAKRQEITKKIAEDFGVSFVPLQGRFDSAALSRGVKYLSADGVHPTPAGHELIARAWIEEFEKIK
ncbi:MAG: SGNH/GDSL hydrolase family protein [Clostridia bacterium]|nr:SGNH/GDSL hydrolase family protein [Clostridia bacterium]